MTESRNSCLWCASGSQKNICLDEAVTPFIKIDNKNTPSDVLASEGVLITIYS